MNGPFAAERGADFPSSENVLISKVVKVKNIDPLKFFLENRRFFPGRNFFWKEKDSDFFMAGFGAAKIIRFREKKDRFLELKRYWEDICEKLIINNPHGPVRGTGPLLFGGFSFRPLKDGALWGNFLDGFFYLPRYLLTKADGETYLTVNGGEEEAVPEWVNRFSEEAEGSGLAEMFPDESGFGAGAYPARGTELQPERWKEHVGKAISLLKEGYGEKVVLAREMKVACEGGIDAGMVLANLFRSQTANYLFLLENGGEAFIGASPERLARKDGERIFSECVAGSAPRGKDPQEDERIGRELLCDEKNLQEHRFVVEMITGAMARYCRDLRVPEQPVILNNPDIKHLYTPVAGILREDGAFFDVLRSLHPTPALGGTPRDVALELIGRLELFERGLYGAPIGWVDHRMDGEFAVGIRSALIRGNEARLFAGCGIVKDSEAEKEFAETRVKFRPMLRALCGKTWDDGGMFDERE